MGRRGKPKSPPFYMFTYEMHNSDAFKAVKPSSLKILMVFLARVKIAPMDVTHYGTDLAVSYQEVQREANVSLGTVSAGFNDLVKIGFLDPVEKGGLRGDQKSTNKFRLSKRWKAFGTREHIEVDWKGFAS